MSKGRQLPPPISPTHPRRPPPRFWACHRAAFAHFGAVPKEILYDRTKTVVRSHVGTERREGDRVYHPEALASAHHYGFKLRLRRPYRPQTKGKVESDVSYVRGRLLRGHGRLAMAREVLAAGHREGAVSAAYYSMLYAARATFSEDDENARSHRGTWNLFRIKSVVTISRPRRRSAGGW